MAEELARLTGANMDIDLATPAGEIQWDQDACPWNAAEGTTVHRCAVKNISLCRHFRGVEFPDTVLCAYPGAGESAGT
ncbi:MAG: hypothetical protein V3S31_06155 [Dehalococcoidia bacterium]